MAVESVASGSVEVAAIKMMSSGLRRRAYRLMFVTGQVDSSYQRKSRPLWNSCHFWLSWAWIPLEQASVGFLAEST